MGILTENEMYLKAAERAFYRNPFSDLLIVSFTTLNSEDDRWKGLQLPVLLVPADGAVPMATRREITRRRRVNLYVWGDSNTVADQTLDELSTFTNGRVYRIVGHQKTEEQATEDLKNAPLDAGFQDQGAPGPGSEDTGTAAAEELVKDTGAQVGKPDMAAKVQDSPPVDAGGNEEKDAGLWQDQPGGDTSAEVVYKGDSLVNAVESAFTEKQGFEAELTQELAEGDDTEESLAAAAEENVEETTGAAFSGPGPETGAEKTPEELMEEAIILALENQDASGETAQDSPGAEDEAEDGGPGAEAALGESGQEPEDADAGPEAAEENVPDSGDSENPEDTKTYGKNVIVWRFPS